MKGSMAVVVLNREGLPNQVLDLQLKVFQNCVVLDRAQKVHEFLDEQRRLSGVEGCFGIIGVEDTNVEVVLEVGLVVGLLVDINGEQRLESLVAFGVL